MRLANNKQNAGRPREAKGNAGDNVDAIVDTRNERKITIFKQYTTLWYSIDGSDII